MSGEEKGFVPPEAKTAKGKISRRKLLKGLAGVLARAVSLSLDSAL